ncbi:MAG: PAS domain S-box protein [Candidatus Odinarchaeota archaeon]
MKQDKWPVTGPDREMIRILHVDDDDLFLELVKEYLETSHSNLQFDSLSTPRDVFQKLEEEKYDAIVSDYQMPDLNGLELLERLRKQENDIPFIIFTGRGREEVVIKALNLGADHYITKGGEPESQFEELAHVITTAVHHKRIEQALQDSEARNRAMLQAIPDLIFQLSRDGRFLSYWGAREELYVPPESFLGKPVPDVLPEKIARQVMHHIEKALQTAEIEVFEYRLPIRGVEHQYETRMVISGENEVLAIIRDITERKKAETALRESEEKFRVLTEQSLLGIAIVQDGKVNYVNHALVDMFGYSIEEILNWPPHGFAKAIHPEDRPFAMEQLQKKLLGSPDSVINYSHRLLTKAGKVKWVDQYSKTTVHGGRPADFITLVDITGRKRVEEELQKSEEKYRSAVNNINDLIFTVDMNGTVLFCNSLSKQFTDCEPEEVLGRNFIEFIHPDDAPGVSVIIQQVLDTGETAGREEMDYECRMVKQNGGVTWIAARSRPIRGTKGEITGFSGIARDITKQKQAETALLGSEARYRTLFENVPMGLYQTTPDGKILAANPALVNMLGYDSFEEFAALNLENKEQYLPTYPRQEIKEQLERNGRVEGLEVDWRTRDGSLITVREHAVAIRDESGTITCYEGSVEDITGRKKTERALQESENLFRSLSESVMVGAVIIQEGNMRHVNETAATITGYTRKEMENWTSEDILSMIHPEDRPLVTGQLNTRKNDMDDDQHFSSRLITKTGETRWVDIHSKPVMYSDSTAVLVTIIDVTDQVKAREELKNQKE